MNEQFLNDVAIAMVEKIAGKSGLGARLAALLGNLGTAMATGGASIPAQVGNYVGGRVAKDSVSPARSAVAIGGGMGTGMAGGLAGAVTGGALSDLAGIPHSSDSSVILPGTGFGIGGLLGSYAGAKMIREGLANEALENTVNRITVNNMARHTENPDDLKAAILRLRGY